MGRGRERGWDRGRERGQERNQDRGRIDKYLPWRISCEFCQEIEKRVAMSKQKESVEDRKTAIE
jgi:hypothetical protein